MFVSPTLFWNAPLKGEPRARPAGVLRARAPFPAQVRARGELAGAAPVSTAEPDTGARRLQALSDLCTPGTASLQRAGLDTAQALQGGAQRAAFPSRQGS